MTTSPSIKGDVNPGYESLRDMFEENFRAGQETQAQLCVYVRGEIVVDLWGSIDSTVEYTGDSLTNIFSSTKNLTSLAMAMMVDRGLLSYSDKIVHHWPEFGQEGKENLTVADLMRHEAGLATIDTVLEPEDLLPENIKQNKIGAVFEQQVLKWPEEGRRQYHALTRGWVANEIFRRVHPNGLTIGQFIKSEVAVPLQTKGIVLGAEEKDISCYQALVNSEYDTSNTQKITVINHTGDESGEIWNSELIRRGETPSANGNCSARGLAKVGAVLANKGQFNTVTLLSLSGWEALHGEATLGKMLGYQQYFTQGGVASWKEGDVRAGFFGWSGYGGSCFQWNPELGISFAYVPCFLMPSISSRDEKNRARAFQVEVVKCVKDNINLK